MATKFKESFRASFSTAREKIWQQKRDRVRLHRSFRRSYHEDYARDLAAPGLLYHTASTFKIIFKNKKLFFGLVLLAVFANIVLVGIMSEYSYTQFQEIADQSMADDQSDLKLGNFFKASVLLATTITTGGLNQGMSDVQQVFAILIFLILWLVTIYLLRHILAGHQLKLRDGLYNALTPLLSTLVVLSVAFVQAIPLMIVIIVYSAAVSTGFLATPFYAFLFFAFAFFMITLSLYLLSSTIIALVATTIPGIYPLPAFRTASDLLASRRIRFIIRLLYLIIVVIFLFVIVMLPVILLDLWLKQSVSWLEGLPIVPFFLLFMFCFSAVYCATYIYLYYRRVLVYDNNQE